MFWTFETDAEGWSEGVGEFTWINTDGVVPGCLYSSGGTSPISSIALTPVMAFVGDPLSCYVKVTATSPAATPNNDITFRLATGGSGIVEHLFACGGVLGFDSGWIRVSGAIDAEGEVDLLDVGCQDTFDATVHIYVDNIYFLESEPTTSSFYGVWQDGLLATYIHYITEFSDVVLGTHVGNHPHVVRGLYDGSFNFNDYTYNLTYCGSYTASYIAEHGATYAATYYAGTACHVRALEWI